MVSVIMPVYNGARFLSRAVEGILAQTFVNLEFIIVNDGSADATSTILDAYTDPRIVRIENEQNVGLARSLNRGMACSRGELIARQDADDISHPERLERQVEFLRAHPEVGAVGATTMWIDASEQELGVWEQPTDNAGIQETLLRYCCLVHGSTVYRRRAAQEVGGYNVQLRTGQDYDLWLRMSESWDMACLSDVLYSYRWHEGMVSNERRSEQAANADLARRRAIERRLSFGWLSAARRFTAAPPRMRTMSRCRLSERYTCWSAGCREVSRLTALRFLGYAFQFDPLSRPAWNYVGGILRRKLGVPLAGRQPATRD